MVDRSLLPDIVPVFPLTGVLLLPGMWLPLHIFEQRYRNMVADAREGDGYIAMIQPLVPRQDNAPPSDGPPENPEVYPVGCLGSIERCEQTPDGCYKIALKGVTRYRLREELPLQRGYRRVAADYREYAGDPEEGALDFDSSRLMEAMQYYGKANNVPFDAKRLGSVPGIALLNGLAMSLPFGPAEKQALLEAPGPAERQQVLLGLMGMEMNERSGAPFYSPPTLN
ncbi:MAG: LON peptidase substrate-binding domain-containing protein [SAR324 cluster bacterium]|nr:LON peptidase substrate-binding domain-containing protein [SAR324 cluster bacterium]